MKAMVYTKYGPPEVLALKDIERPVPRKNEVLIKVFAASVNAWDWDLLRGTPFFNRLEGPLKPKHRILGADIAGRVEAVGPEATRFQPGDEVFGDLCRSGWGGFAEYVCARESALALKPAGLAFDQAAAVPQAGLLALQGLRHKGNFRPGQKVLINGAGGGVGTFAIQIAKSVGSHVTGVDSTSKLDLMRSIGADQVIDYTREDFTKTGDGYDLIIDVAAFRSIFDYKRALNPGGTFVMVGGSMAMFFQILLWGPWLSMVGNKRLGILMYKPNKEISLLKELIEAGQVVPVIDRRYPLTEVPEAIQYLGEGNARGKVVITME